jgi:hypothetical protein
MNILFCVIEYFNLHSSLNYFFIFLFWLLLTVIFIYLHRWLSIYLIRYLHRHFNLHFDFLCKKHIKIVSVPIIFKNFIKFIKFIDFSFYEVQPELLIKITGFESYHQLTLIVFLTFFKISFFIQFLWFVNPKFDHITRKSTTQFNRLD